MMTSTTVLTHDELKVYPSVMANHPAGRTSGRYSFIPTTRVIEQFEASGFYPVKVQEARAGEERMGFQKHIVRFRQPGASSVGLDQLFPEIVLVNSHDAGAAFHLMAGLFRLVCTNGMIVGESMLEGVKINHIGYTDAAVREAVRMMGERLPQVMDKAEQWKTLEMTPDDQGVFALNGLRAKYGRLEIAKRVFDLKELVKPKRIIDQAPTLWSTFNTVQERLVEKGGPIEVRQMVRSGRDRVTRAWTNARHVNTRPVNSPTENVKVNQRLWNLTVNTEKEIKEHGHFSPGATEMILERLRMEVLEELRKAA